MPRASRTKQEDGQTRAPTRARTPAQLERQEKAYHASVVLQMSHRAIAKELKVDKDTIADDIRHESRARVEANAANREYNQANALAMLAEVIRRALRRDSRGQVGDRSLDTIVRAQEQIHKLLGLDAPTKVEVGIQDFLKAFEVPAPGEDPAPEDED